MLYDRWHQVLREHRDEIAVFDLAANQRWTFAELEQAVEADARHASAHPANHPPSLRAEGNGLPFLRQTLLAWRLRRPLLPLDRNLPAIPNAIPNAVPAGFPPRIVHVKQTSATTGQPRLVLFTAEQLAADADQIVSTMGLRPDWPNVSCISLAHSYGFSNLVLPLLLHGIPIALLDSPLPESVRRAFATVGSVTLPAVPALWRTWHDAGILHANIQLAISAGAPLPVQLESTIFQTTGLKIHNFYGSTECGGIAYDRTTAPRQDAACVGTPMNQVTLRINDAGCLEVHSRAVGQGYWPPPDPHPDAHDSAEAASALVPGCFRTSDLAEIQDGAVYLRGRASDLINVAGRKVAPETIEHALRAHAQVADCLVFGVPLDASERGDRMVACVVARAPQTLTDDELRRFLLTQLPAWQVPKEWRFLDALETNQRGKRSRAEWRARLGFSK